MKFCIYDCTKEEKTELEEQGLYVYDLRMRDDWEDIGTIEPHVRVNNVGSIVTNEPIIFADNNDKFVDYMEFVENNEQVDKLEELKGVK